MCLWMEVLPPSCIPVHRERATILWMRTVSPEEFFLMEVSFPMVEGMLFLSSLIRSLLTPEMFKPKPLRPDGFPPGARFEPYGPSMC